MLAYIVVNRLGVANPAHHVIAPIVEASLAEMTRDGSTAVWPDLIEAADRHLPEAGDHA
jgi:hypothetical protein